MHLPIAFLLAASILDILSYLAVRFPASFHSIVNIFAHPYASTKVVAIIYHLSLFSYASTIVAIITSVPALVTGLIEGSALISANGLDLKNPKVRTTITHATLNDVAIFAAVYNWMTRRNVEDFMPWGGNALVSSAILGLISYSAYLGGSLVYEYGVGVQRQGTAKEEKQMEEEKEKISVPKKKK